MRGYELTLIVQGNLIDGKSYEMKVTASSYNLGDKEGLWNEFSKLEARMKWWMVLVVPWHRRGWKKVTKVLVRSVEDMPVDLDDAIRDFYHHMSEVRVDRIVGIETTQRQLKVDQMIASGERSSMAKNIKSLRSKNLKVHAMLCIERDRVDSLCLHMSRSQEEFRQIHDDRDNLWRSLRRTMTNTRAGMTPTVIEEMINQRVTEALEAHEINRNLGHENLNGNGNDRNGNGNANGGNGNEPGGNGNRNRGNDNGQGG
nr:hypothetical protein [Tanacetum cinerariifolium]